MTKETAAAMEDPGPFGSSFDSFLEEEGILEEVHAYAIKSLVADQMNAEIQRQKVSISALARRLKTSRSQLTRLLDPGTTAVTLEKLDELAASLGKRVHIELVDASAAAPVPRMAARAEPRSTSAAAPRRKAMAHA
jgi:antitoxin HicB